MNERLAILKKQMRDGEHKALRRGRPIDLLPECENEGLSWPRRVARLVRRQCEAEQVVIRPEEKIVFTRTLPGVPPVYSAEEWARITAGRTLHELGPVSNICADWELVLTQACLAAGKLRGLHASSWRMIWVRLSSSTVSSKPSTQCWVWLLAMLNRPVC